MKFDPDSNEMIVTKIGKYIRIIKVDEILQLINVLKKKDIEVLLTLGAGDISTMVEPIKALYN